MPDKYDLSRRFATYEDAKAYADRKLGRVHISYELRAPNGTTWDLFVPLPDTFRGVLADATVLTIGSDEAVGSVVTDRRYWVGHIMDGRIFPTLEEAVAAVRGAHGVNERLSMRTPSGTEFEVSGARDH